MAGSPKIELPDFELPLRKARFTKSQEYDDKRRFKYRASVGSQIVPSDEEKIGIILSDTITSICVTVRPKDQKVWLTVPENCLATIGYVQDTIRKRLRLVIFCISRKWKFNVLIFLLLLPSS